MCARLFLLRFLLRFLSSCQVHENEDEVIMSPDAEAKEHSAWGSATMSEAEQEHSATGYYRCRQAEAFVMKQQRHDGVTERGDSFLGERVQLAG